MPVDIFYYRSQTLLESMSHIARMIPKEHQDVLLGGKKRAAYLTVLSNSHPVA